MSVETGAREPAHPDGDSGFHFLLECGDPIMAALVDRIGPLDHGARPPTPAELIAADEDALRAVGISRQKIGYLRDLAHRVYAGELELDALQELPDEEVFQRITAVNGLGRWSADMFQSITLAQTH